MLRLHFAVLVVVPVAVAVAECPETWAPNFAAPGADGPVLAVTALDTGSGPSLYAGGGFLSIDGVSARGVARWDGHEWQALGSGLGGNESGGGFVQALTVYDGQIVAAGEFCTPGQPSLCDAVVWNGTTWTPMNANLGWDPEVNALVVYNGSLYAGGDLWNNDNTGGLRRWNGSEWVGVGGGVNGYVNALAVFNGRLYVGGEFESVGASQTLANGIAAWDGNTWHTFGSGLSTDPGNSDPNEPNDPNDPNTGGSTPFVSALHVHNNQLIVGGNFDAINGQPYANIARFNGTSWSSLGSGMDLAVLALTTHHSGALIAGGNFTIAGGVSAQRLARWNGTTWSAEGTGCDSRVESLASFDDKLVVASGSFRDFSPSPFYCPYIHQHDGSEWSSVGGGQGISGGEVWAMQEYNGSLYVGGTFRAAGTQKINRLARWDGSQWHRVGNAMVFFAGGVYAMTVYNDELIVGGEFGSADGSFQHNSLARWNGSQWLPMDNGVSWNFGGQGTVYALQVSGGDLYVGGAFDRASGAPMPHMVRWNGSTYSPVGTTPGQVQGLTRYNNELVAAGYLSPGGVKRFDGASWTPLGGGINTLGGYAESIEAIGGNLYLSGAFSTVGGVATGPIARWNGSTWNAMGASLNNLCWDFIEHDGDLIAGGYFTQSGTQPLNQIARWDGNAWHEIGGGIRGGGVFSLGKYNGELFVGGSFRTAGNVYSTGIARLIACGLDGDVDRDGDVDLTDLAQLLAAFGLCDGAPGYNAGADFNADDCVNLTDLAVLLANFGL